jgi:hypothetical protein
MENGKVSSTNASKKFPRLSTTHLTRPGLIRYQQRILEAKETAGLVLKNLRFRIRASEAVEI